MSERFPHQAEMEEPFEDESSLIWLAIYGIVLVIYAIWTPVRWIQKKSKPVQIPLTIAGLVIAVEAFGFLTVVAWLGTAISGCGLWLFWRNTGSVYGPKSMLWILIMLAGFTLSILSHRASN